ncbi:Perilipin family-domain-containing protein [Parasitella parasitica]|nr:Perilipin family-domain-containing protein [Parasitella parasitica]
MLGQDGYVNSSEDVNSNLIKKGGQDFVDRVASIPLVKDTVVTAQEIANKTSIGRFALSTANSTFSTVAQYAAKNQPKYLQSYYETYLQPQIEKADAFGCRSLDTLQSKVPIINQPSSEIIKTLTQPSYQIIDGVRVKIDNTIQTVTHPAHVVVRNANKTLSTAVDNIEGVVDKYLPPTPSSSNGHGTSTMNGNATQHTDKENGNQVKRVYGVLNEASRRLTVKVSDQVSRSTSGIPKSRQDLSQLATIQKLQNNLKFIQDTMTQSVKVYSEAAQKRLPASITFCADQVHALFTQVTQSVQSQIVDLVHYVKSPQVPAWLKQQLATAIDKVKHQLTYIKTELARTDISYTAKVKGVAMQLQQQVLPLLENMNSQIKAYADAIKEKAQDEMKTPLLYLGINQKAKVD